MMICSKCKQPIIHIKHAYWIGNGEGDKVHVFCRDWKDILIAKEKKQKVSRETAVEIAHKYHNL